MFAPRTYADRLWKLAQVYEILEGMRIGTLPEDERAVATSDPYANEPLRDPSIVVRSETPFNGETPTEWLNEWITPNHMHYVRHHMPVPDVVADAFELQARRRPACRKSCTDCYASMPNCDRVQQLSSSREPIARALAHLPVWQLCSASAALCLEPRRSLGSRTILL